MPFGLQQAVIINRAYLADRTIGRAGNASVVGYVTGTFFQLAGKEVIKE